MGLFSKFEGKMEDTFEGAANKMFDAPISPVQIAKKAEKQMRREKMVGAGKQYAPTLYTVLVNPEDDERLFGYYPTLAGETETYLMAKASEDGLVMDGQPLVRFIVDDGLKHGKFDIIAEPVASPIIEQLRAEEMHRYGLGPAPQKPRRAPQPQFNANPAPQQNAPQANYGYNQPAPVPQARPQSDSDLSGLDQFQPIFGETSDEDFLYPKEEKPSLPYVPEEEIDYSVDYGEYTFNSQDFDDYDRNGASATPTQQPAQQSFPAQGQPMGAPGMPMGAQPQAAPANLSPDTVVFAAGAGNAQPTPNAGIVRARLINTTENRTYDLATARLILGRDTSNNIVVNDINASRSHAELRFEPQGVWSITDLGSTNGTTVNGSRISSQPLNNGDRITIGMTNFIFSLT